MMKRSPFFSANSQGLSLTHYVIQKEETEAEDMDFRESVYSQVTKRQLGSSLSTFRGCSTEPHIINT